MRDIMPEHVRQWVTWMTNRGASAQTIGYCRGSILNAIFTTGLDDGVVTIHASRGVKTPPTPAKPRRTSRRHSSTVSTGNYPTMTPGWWWKPLSKVARAGVS
jgi:hypothetical protein